MNHFQKLHPQIIKDFHSKSDPKYKKSMGGFIVGGKAKKYGVRMPILRKILTILNKDLKKLSDKDYLEFIKSLYAAGSYEEMVLAVLLIQKRHRVLNFIDEALQEKWVKRVDNWASNDVLACWAVGPWVLLDTKRVAFLKSWLVSENLWYRRMSLVSLIPPVREGKLRKEALVFVDKVKHEREPMITKAVSWLLREMVRKGGVSEVKTYLEKNKNVLAPLVVREVNNKITTGLKNPKKS